MTVNVRLERPPPISVGVERADGAVDVGLQPRARPGLQIESFEHAANVVAARRGPVQPGAAGQPGRPTPTTLPQLTAATLTVRAAVRGVDLLAAAEVDADVADRRVEEQQVAGLGRRRRDVRHAAYCGARLVRQRHAGLAPTPTT